MNAEEFEAGFWPGDERFREASFFAYTYPKPEGIEKASIQPDSAFWSREMGEFLLPYESVRTERSPRDAVLAFLESTYQAGARLGGWDLSLFEKAVPQAA